MMEISFSTDRDDSNHDESNHDESNPFLDDSLIDDSAGDPSRRLRWWRRILVGLLAVCLLVAIGLIPLLLTSESQPAAIDLLPQVQLEQMLIKMKQQGSHQLHVEDFVVDDTMMQQLKDHPNLETIILDRGEVTDQSIGILETMPNLQHVRLRLSPLSDEALKRLANCKSLWFLNLPHSTCTAKGVASLSSIPGLRQLRLGSPNLGNEVTREIANLKTLRGIHLVGVPVTDEGLKTLSTLPYLESLYLDNSAVTETGWRWVYVNHPEIHVHVNQVHNDYDPKYHKHHDH